VERNQPRGEKLIKARKRLIAWLVKESGNDGSFPEKFVVYGEFVRSRGFTNHALKKAIGLPFSNDTIALCFQWFAGKSTSSDDRLHRQLPDLPKNDGAAREA